MNKFFFLTLLCFFTILTIQENVYACLEYNFMFFDEDKKPLGEVQVWFETPTASVFDTKNQFVGKQDGSLALEFKCSTDDPFGKEIYPVKVMFVKEGYFSKTVAIDLSSRMLEESEHIKYNQFKTRYEVTLLKPFRFPDSVEDKVAKVDDKVVCKDCKTLTVHFLKYGHSPMDIFRHKKRFEYKAESILMFFKDQENNVYREDLLDSELVKDHGGGKFVIKYPKQLKPTEVFADYKEHKEFRGYVDMKQGDQQFFSPCPDNGYCDYVFNKRKSSITKADMIFGTLAIGSLLVKSGQKYLRSNRGSSAPAPAGSSCEYDVDEEEWNYGGTTLFSNLKKDDFRTVWVMPGIRSSGQPENAQINYDYFSKEYSVTEYWSKKNSNSFKSYAAALSWIQQEWKAKYCH